MAANTAAALPQLDGVQMAVRVMAATDASAAADSVQRVHGREPQQPSTDRGSCFSSVSRRTAHWHFNRAYSNDKLKTSKKQLHISPNFLLKYVKNKV